MSEERLSRNFTRQELACTCCGDCKIHPEMIAILQSIRNFYGKPLFVSSGYRCPKHPVEVMKDKPGEHAHGMAVDIICHGALALEIMRNAQALGVTRIGINQKGRASSRFIHLGIADDFLAEFPKNSIWTY